VAGRRSGTVCGRWAGRERVPDLRLSGRWLGAAGFDLGKAYEVEVQAGMLVVRAV
jgi:Toxin SymE, type I toxin-antitoxin system